LAAVPGSIYTLRCPGCSADHKLLTGEFDDGKLLGQRVCPRCRLIVSDFSYEEDEDSDRCPNCASELVSWAGRAWLERNPDGTVGRERIEGPCPRCGAALSQENATRFGLWD
jgi:ssDNA-binding Zn-finger/Zn-ribbon topoisomerase 1